MINSTRIRSLGVKPDKGGRPPIDKSVKEINTIIIGVFDHVEDNEDKEVEYKIRNEINKEEVIRIYKVRANTVKEGKIGIIAIIQPRWAIEE